MRERAMRRAGHAPMGGVFLVTYFGAAIYFVEKTNGFWGTVWGMMEALVWPGFVVYHALKLMNA
jgi:hypothetical protein